MVDGDEEFGDVAAFGAWVDVGEAAVDAFHGIGAFASSQAADELAEDGAPVYDARDALADFFPEFCGDVSPAVGLGVGVFRGFFDDVLETAFDGFALFFGDVFPACVVVHGVQVAEWIAVGVAVAVAFGAFFFDFVLEFFEVPLRRLTSRKASDELRDGHGVFFFFGVFPAFWAFGEDAWDEAAVG